MNIFKNSRSFTLIELLVVVSIIAVLAAMTIPQVIGIIQRAQDVAIKRSMRVMVTEAIRISIFDGDLSRIHCGTGGHPDILAICETIRAQSPRPAQVRSFATARTFCIQAPLHDDTFWRVDETGFIGHGFCKYVTTVVHPSPTAHDWCGWSVATGDLNADGRADLIMGCLLDDHTALSDPGSAVVFLRNAANTGFDPGIVLVHPIPASNDWCGYSVAAGDLNADGRVDVIMSCPWDDHTALTDPGSAVVFLRNAANTGFDPGITLVHPSPAGADQCGYSVAAGDLNADGRADLIMGCLLDDHTALSDPGSAVVFLRNAANTGFDPGIALLHPSPAANDLCGSSVAAGDFNQDGRADLIMGCRGDDHPTGDQGSAIVFLRNAANTGFDPGMTLLHPTPASHDHCGYSVAAGDLNADGRADLIMGCFIDDQADLSDPGSAVVFLRNAANTGFDPGIVLVHPIPASNDWCGSSVAAGDLNADGRADLIISCRMDDQADLSDSGSAVVFLRNAANTGFDPGIAFFHPSPAVSDRCGYSVAAGDLNADGRADLIIGCRLDDVTATNQGSAVIQK